MFRIKVYNETLSDVRFKTFGCAATIAASSMLTVLAAGKTLEEAMNITNDDVAESLGGLPPKKLECSNIAADALHDAINDYRSRKTQDIVRNEKLPENTTERLVNTNQSLEDTKQIQRYLRHIIVPKISGAGHVDWETWRMLGSLRIHHVLITFNVEEDKFHEFLAKFRLD